MAGSIRRAIRRATDTLLGSQTWVSSVLLILPREASLPLQLLGRLHFHTTSPVLTSCMRRRPSLLKTTPLWELDVFPLIPTASALDLFCMNVTVLQTALDAYELSTKEKAC